MTNNLRDKIANEIVHNWPREDIECSFATRDRVDKILDEAVKELKALLPDHESLEVNTIHLKKQIDQILGKKLKK